MQSIYRAALCSCAIVTLLMVSTSAKADVQYTYYNGQGSTDHNAIGTAAGTSLWIANEFTAQAGGESITQIRVGFGFSAPVGSAVKLLVYEDPNDDGLPNDLILKSSTDGVVQFATNVSPPNPLFSIYDIAPTLVSGRFFIAVLVPQTVAVGNMFYFEQTDPQSRSWIAEDSPNVFPINNPASAASAPVNLDTLIPNSGVFNGFGEFLIEATGTVAIPEPAITAVIAMMGLAGFGRRTRQIS